MSRDIRNIEGKGFLTFFNDIERSVLPDTFWEVTLPQNLETSSVNSPAFNTFLAAQINMNKNSLFMHGTMISDLLEISGDVHHIFPKAYLKANGVTVKSRYNQVANFTYLDTQVNKAISDDAPAVYFKTVMEQFGTGNAEIGNIMEKTITDAVKEKRYDNLNCRAEARDKISRYVMRETGKRPMILPAIVEINTKD